MWLLVLSFLFGLIHVISGQSYDDLVKDECFKKVYVCGDFRVNVTGATGQLITEPRQFSEICRRHKKFIECIDDASEFCIDKFTNFSRLVLDNRLSLKKICTEPEWKKRYFVSAPCIYKYERKFMEDCRREEMERDDDRPGWCLVPEPCDAIQRVFTCSVQKMEKNCGSETAEIYRRMHILKLLNQDVVCEFRRLNTKYCPYQTAKDPQRQARQIVEDSDPQEQTFVRKTGSLQPSFSEVVTDIVKAVAIDVTSSIVRAVESYFINSTESKILEDSLEILLKKILFDVDPDYGYLSRKTYDIGSEEAKPSIGGESTATVIPNSEHSTSSENLLHEMCQLDADSEECNQEATLAGDGTGKDVDTRTSEHANAIQYVKDYIIKLYDTLNDGKDIAVEHVDDGRIAVYWKNSDGFPPRDLNCSSLPDSFKCTFSTDYHASEEIVSEIIDLIQEVPSYPEIVILEPSRNLADYEYSVLDSLNEESRSTAHASTADMELDDTSARDESTMDSISSNDEDMTDIHRFGNRHVSLDENGEHPSEEMYENTTPQQETADTEFETATEATQFITGKSFVLLDTPRNPMDSEPIYLTMENLDSTATEVYLVSPESLSSAELGSADMYSEATVNLETTSKEQDTEKLFSESSQDSLKSRSLKEFQLHQIEVALNDIFDSVDTTVHESRETASNKKINNSSEGKLHSNVASRQEELFEFNPYKRDILPTMPSYKLMNLDGGVDVYKDEIQKIEDSSKSSKQEGHVPSKVKQNKPKVSDIQEKSVDKSSDDTKINTNEESEKDEL